MHIIQNSRNKKGIHTMKHINHIPDLQLPGFPSQSQGTDSCEIILRVSRDILYICEHCIYIFIHTHSHVLTTFFLCDFRLLTNPRDISIYQYMYRFIYLSAFLLRFLK